MFLSTTFTVIDVANICGSGKGDHPVASRHPSLGALGGVPEGRGGFTIADINKNSL